MIMTMAVRSLAILIVRGILINAVIAGMAFSRAPEARNAMAMISEERPVRVFRGDLLAALLRVMTIARLTLRNVVLAATEYWTVAKNVIGMAKLRGDKPVSP